MRKRAPRQAPWGFAVLGSGGVMPHRRGAAGLSGAIVIAALIAGACGGSHQQSQPAAAESFSLDVAVGDPGRSSTPVAPAVGGLKPGTFATSAFTPTLRFNIATD